MNPVGRLTIRQVAELTRLSTQLIRKWEERYDLIKPQRLSNGYRVYTEQDVEKLLKVKALVEQHYSLQTAVMMVKDTEMEYQNPSASSDRNTHAASLIEQLIEAGAACDEPSFMRLLQSASFSYSLPLFLQEVIQPFLQKVGDLWESGEWNEYQEHISSQLVRDFLSQLRKGIHQNPKMPLIFGACLPFEQHEIPVHMILLLAAQMGWRSLFFCPRPAVGAIEQAVEQLQPRKVVLSAVTTHPFEQVEGLLERLDIFAAKHPYTHFYLGGKGAMRYARGKELLAIILTDDINEVLAFPGPHSGNTNSK